MLIEQLTEELKVLFARILGNQREVDAQQFEDEIKRLRFIRLLLVWCHTTERCKTLSELFAHCLIWAIKEPREHKLISVDVCINRLDKFVEKLTTVQ